MIRKAVTLTTLAVLGLSLLLGAAPAGAGSGLAPDEVIVWYPQGYTKLLVADLAKIMADETLAAGFLTPLAAARHALNGIAETIGLFGIDPAQVEYVAHGEGPGMTMLSLIQGPPQEQTMDALFGLKFAAGAPGSPYENWDLQTIGGFPVVRTGGTFGPVQIQWAYLPTAHALWVATEVGFVGPPDTERLEASVQALIGRLSGEVGYFDELPIAWGLRGGDVAFVRATDPTVDKPLAAGEQAMGFSLVFTPEGVRAHFIVRFDSEASALTAQAALLDGTSPYLAQDLYQGQLISARTQGRQLLFEVAADLRGAVGLLILVMPF